MTAAAALGLKRTGRAPKPVMASVVRELTPGDVARLLEPLGVRPRQLKRLRERHHWVAKLMAQGLSDAQIVAMTGMAHSTLSILRGDRSFRELLHHYQNQVDEEFETVVQKLAALSHTVLDEIMDRLEADEGGKIPLERLQGLLETALDRTGHGKTTKVNVGIGGLSSDELESIKGAVHEHRVVIGQARLISSEPIQERSREGEVGSPDEARPEPAEEAAVESS